MIVRDAERKVQPRRAKSDRKRLRRPAGVGWHASLAIVLEIKARQDSPGMPHIVAILVSEALAHHPLFAWRANKVHERKRHESVPAGEPVLKKQTLRQSPDPDGRVHWMADRMVNALCDQLMTFADFQGLGPVQTQVRMGAPEKPQPCYHQHRAAPRRQRWEVIVGKGKPRSK